MCTGVQSRNLRECGPVTDHVCHRLEILGGRRHQEDGEVALKLDLVGEQDGKAPVGRATKEKRLEQRVPGSCRTKVRDRAHSLGFPPHPL